MTSENSESQDIWLTDEQQDVWLDVWTMRIGLPARLDAQLKEAAGVSHFEYFTMAQISMAPERRVRMSELAELSDMTLSHLSRVVTRLEKAGWVKRVPDPDDGRATVAVLTDSGWEKVKATAPGHVKEVRRLVFDDLTPEELKVMGTAMKKIVNRLDMSNRLPRV
ncbi:MULTISPECIES: MarR family winged helix-turn-helix transcriptional regulator [Corynebacterium]|uniref:MarR family transcriptional regulator n=1 Tax=[Brevibacterium] flavum TaxID=92706 RepID=A0A0F6SRP4_9CORY|nr:MULTISPECIES: MarR family transcriptional regulator [Corynebacterium]AKF28314.1 MarR family transcriptional regulator [[Brevibacterium] flavum]AMA00951.1 MarR family transcriptional regulator [Corynebacterium glutamicum]ANE09150.1 MarR family transcriptional regulator [Corynebacterium glutamicum]AST21562.1 MarR family transcriptional regulator [Corynebacterium glutamicum ATCC 14067]KEI24084.1 MarR family transcriptional regulator [Corynebacterium glutamicum ATCC 14067]